MASNRNTLFECDDCKRMFQSMEMFTLHNCADTATGGFTPADLDEDNEVGELGNISIDSLPDIPDTAVWNRPATLLLIEGYRSREDLLNQGKLRKRALWKLIKKDLQEKGFRYNEQQVEGRWKSLMRGIKTIADHNRKSGNSKKAHPYENELQFCITRANVALNQVVNSSQPRPSTSTSGEQATDPVTQKRKSNDDQELKTKKQKRNPSSSYKSPLSQVMDVMTTFVQASEKRHQEELARQERCHQDKMNLFANFLDHLKNSK